MTPAARTRIDQILVRRGLVETRERGVRLILAGEVVVEGLRVDKPGTLVAADAAVDIRRRSPFVSRGGDKLAHALRVFDVRPSGRVCLDVGASTGGFTDCLLQHGASQVYAVDVGTGQLDARLRGDPRVVPMERTNARSLDPDRFPERPTLATVDVAFISLDLVLPGTRRILAPGAELVVLVKPQFEAGRAAVGKGGVVRDPEVHRAVLVRVCDRAADLELRMQGVTVSPLRGPKGNVEFFLHLRDGGSPMEDMIGAIALVTGTTA